MLRRLQREMDNTNDVPRAPRHVIERRVVQRFRRLCLRMRLAFHVAMWTTVHRFLEESAPRARHGPEPSQVERIALTPASRRAGRRASSSGVGARPGL